MKACIIVLLLLVTVSCLAVESQLKPPDNTQAKESPSVSNVDLSRWQTVRLSGNGIEFQLPPDWRQNEFHLEQASFIIDQWDWTGPNKESVLISVTTYLKGFISSRGTVASKEELVDDRVNRMTRMQDSVFSQVRKHKISGVEGVLIMRRIVFEDGVRMGPLWTGYRLYRGKAQKIEAEVASDPQREALLRTIFNTIEIEQDKEANPNP